MDKDVTETKTASIIVPLEVIGLTDESPIYSRTFTETIIREEFTDIKGTRRRLNLAYEQYARKLLLDGRLEGVRLGRKGYTKWFITLESISLYKENVLRANRPRRYILRIDKEKEGKIRELLDKEGIRYELEVAYTSPKNKNDKEI